MRFRSAALPLLATGLFASALVAGCDNSVGDELRPPDPEAVPDGWSLVWQDEFDGAALDTTKWSYQIGDGCAEGICGWGNGEFQNYTRENVEVSGGTLKITARQTITPGDSTDADTTYTSSRIRTLDKGDWTYGRFDVRAKLPTGQGLWPAIWLLFSDPVYGVWASSGEIDIMEAIGSEPGEVFGTLHFGGPAPGNVFTSEDFQLNFSLFNEDFYLFTTEWERDEIRWYVNNVLYRTETADNWYSTGTPSDSTLIDPMGTAPFNHDFHMILNVAVGGNLPGAPDVSTFFPQTMEVDYVRVYQRED
jgi:beta-glucanase (GH16 family)